MTDTAHKSWWQIGEVVFGVPFMIALALQFIAPFSIRLGGLKPILILGGALLILGGIALISLARQELAKHRQPTDPGHPTTYIVSTGVFSVSRNPIYLGAACFLIGIGLAFNLPWVLLLQLPALIACHYVLIAPEEKYLNSKFGGEYQAYAASVRRWIGRSQRPGKTRE